MEAPAIVVMGVTSSGKSSVGEALAARLGLSTRDADSFHPEANVAKMSAGIPLTDDDRRPWLDAIAAWLRATEKTGAVASCSALKRAYRDRIRAGAGRPVTIVFLDGARETLARRMAARRGHFMPVSLLDSQLATLERPTPDENAVVVSVEPSKAEVLAAVLAALAARGIAP